MNCNQFILNSYLFSFRLLGRNKHCDSNHKHTHRAELLNTTMELNRALLKIVEIETASDSFDQEQQQSVINETSQCINVLSNFSPTTSYAINHLILEVCYFPLKCIYNIYDTQV